MTFYAKDGSVVWPDQPPAKGHAAIRAVWESSSRRVPGMYLDFKPDAIEVSSGRDMASDFGVVHFAPGAKPGRSQEHRKISRGLEKRTRRLESALRLLELERAGEGPPMSYRKAPKSSK